jgi:hypothetical protein
MADFVFNIAKGAAAEKFRDGAANGIVLLVTAMEADSAAKDWDDLAGFLGAAGTTEKSDGGYARKTGLTGTVSVDDTNDRVDVDIPGQTWSSLTGTAVTDLVVAYEEAAADANRIPLTAHDFAVTPDGSDVTAQFNASGFYRAT